MRRFWSDSSEQLEEVYQRKMTDPIIARLVSFEKCDYIRKSIIDIVQFSLADLIGRPHSIIRQPDMPRCVFQLLWDTIQNGEEIFAYTKDH